MEFMTEKQIKLIEFYTREGRKPNFIEDINSVDENTPLEDILYTYNEMVNRNYSLEDRCYFLQRAEYRSKKPSFCFLYPNLFIW